MDPLTSIMRLFQNQIALVTGAASGIGRALSFALAQGGARVYVADINDIGLKEVVGQIRAQGQHAESILLDVSSQAAVEQVVNEIAAREGRIDYLFNNAAIAIVGEFRDGSIEDFRRLIDVNLFGVIHGSLAAYQIMLRQKSGHIINVSSMTGLMPTPILTAYSTSKWGIIGFSTALRLEAETFGVKVSVACPGLVRTNIPDRTIYWNVKKEEYLAWLPFQNMMLSPEKAAEGILRGVVNL